MKLTRDLRATLAATLASALTGAMLLLLLLAFNWPRPLIDWMRVRVPRFGPLPPDYPMRLMMVCLVVTLLLAVAVLAIRWALLRLRVRRPAVALAIVLLLVFAMVFVEEAASLIIRTSGALTASDTTGDLLDEGRLTLHGWETIARRAAAAALYAGLMAGMFRAVLTRMKQGDMP
jgi:hypothetical protein